MTVKAPSTLAEIMTKVMTFANGTTQTLRIKAEEGEHFE